MHVTILGFYYGMTFWRIDLPEYAGRLFYMRNSDWLIFEREKIVGKDSKL